MAKRAQESTVRMEKLTNEMNDLARKTKQETVSMKVITLVTLFFLPGTFMSASILSRDHFAHLANTEAKQTIMSTDIIRFQEVNGKTDRTFQSGALKLYLAITLPMMFLTFAGWWIFYKRVDRDTNNMAQKDENKSKG